MAAVIAGASAGTYKIRAFSESELREGTHNLMLRVTFVDYPLSDNENYPEATTDFRLVIQQATCDCGLITWDTPA